MSCAKAFAKYSPTPGKNLPRIKPKPIRMAVCPEKSIILFFVCPNAKCPSSCATTVLNSDAVTFPEYYAFRKPSVR